MSIMLPPEFEAFVHTCVASGAYALEQDVFRTAFDLLAKRESLLAHIDEGTRQFRTGQFAEYGEREREKFLADIATAGSRVNAPST